MVAVLFAFATMMSLSGCIKSWGSRGYTTDPIEPERPSRNCQQEFNQLVQKKFYSTGEARSAALDFLCEFNNGQYPECIEQVRQMDDEVAEMEKLFADVADNRPIDRYCAFCSMVKSNDYTFSRSSFESVRKTWEYLMDEKGDDYLRERVNLIDENEFKPYLMSFAKDIACERFGSSWVMTSGGCYILNNQLEEVTPVDGKAAKRGVCTVHVSMEGALFGLRKGYVEIQVEGILGVSDSGCNVFFSKGNHRIVHESK